MVLDSEPPWEKFPVPASKAPKPVVAARPSVPFTPPHVSTRQPSLEPGRTTAASAVRSGNVVEVDAVTTSRVPSKAPFVSIRSKWRTLTAPDGAVQVSGVPPLAVPPGAGAVIFGRGGAPPPRGRRPRQKRGGGTPPRGETTPPPPN